MPRSARDAPRPVARGSGRVRIIGGRWRRRYLDVADAPGLRPTPDRVRETLFNWLSHRFGGDLAGRSALDLFAGSGALGFEAASRGAASVTVVDVHPAALVSLAASRTALGAEQVHIRVGDARTVGRALVASGTRFDVVFVDPPFGRQWLADALPLSSDLVHDDGYVYVECEAALEADTAAAAHLTIVRADRAGDVFYHLLQRNKKNDEETAC